MPIDVVMHVKGLSKSFGGVKALDDVSLTFYSGEIHAVLGQNGAGKSTLVKLLTGVHHSSGAQGKMYLKGQPLSLQSSADALKQGIGYVPQEIELVDNLTVAENIFAGQLPTKHGIFSSSVLHEKARQVIQSFDLDLPLNALAASLGSAQRQMVMIARALASNPSILLLDEPTTSLSTEDAQSLSRTLVSLRAKGVTMIYVTHRIPEVISLCDRATVLRDGRVSASLEKNELNEEQIIGAMIGEGFSREHAEIARTHLGRPFLEVAKLTAEATGPQSISIQDVSFDLYSGEILGVGGLVGSGRTELLHALYGLVPSTGSLRLEGETYSKRNPRMMRSMGIFLLAEDRKREGLLFNLNLVQNVTAGSVSLFAKLGLILRKKEADRAINQMEALSVKTSSYAADPHQLSGGNQQKLLLARILIENPKILLLDEPTKGVDVGARQEIYRIIRKLKDAGTSIIVVSSDLEELLMIAERVIVMAGGRKVDEFFQTEGDETRILKGSAGIKVI